MTNRQSNIVFYVVISIIIYALLVNHFYPDFFDSFTKSKEELSIKEALDKGEHNKALTIYQQLLEERLINNDGGNNAETADMYEEMAKLHLSLGNKIEEKKHYLKSLKIKKQLKENNTFSIANTYTKLGSLAEEEHQYDQAQMYYEKSLSKMLGRPQESGEDNTGIVEGMHDEGIVEGMQNAQQRYKRLNNEWIIAAFKKLGAIHHIKKEYVIAKKYYMKALTASKLTFGEDDIKTLEIRKLMTRLAL